MHSLRHTRLASLDCHIYEPEEAATRAVVLCHGFGAPGDDLAGLGPLFAQSPVGPRTRWVFPEAPLDLASIGMPWGRAWWELDLEALAGGRNWERFHEEAPEGLPAARRALEASLSALEAGTGLGRDQTFIGGFSQGSMLATDLSLRSEEPFAGLIALSGAPVHRPEWQRRLERRPGLRAFQSHGRQDAVLPFSSGTLLKELLEAGGAAHTWVSFDGGHELGPEVLRGLIQWLGEAPA